MSTEFHRATERKARTEKKCDLCGGKILIGSTYVDTASKCTGYDVFSAKLHVLCNRIVDKYGDTYQEEFALDNVLDDITDFACYGCAANDGCDYPNAARCEVAINKYLQEAAT